MYYFIIIILLVCVAVLSLILATISKVRRNRLIQDICQKLNGKK